MYVNKYITYMCYVYCLSLFQSHLLYSYIPDIHMHRWVGKARLLEIQGNSTRL